jgi:hypothetical protein
MMYSTVRHGRRALILALVVFAVWVGGGALAPDRAHATYRHPHRLNSAARAMVLYLRETYHVSPAEIEAAKDLTYQESSWSPRCVTGRYVGLWQVNRFPHWRDPRRNTHVAMHYIRHRYGTIRRALAHSRAHGWY